MTEPLPSGSTIGILGGGQLGRMLSVAASRLGYRTHIFEPASAPAADVSAVWTQAPYDDLDALRTFAQSCDVITYEFENIPADALDILTETTPLHPNRRALETSQDRLTEKRFLSDLGLTTAPFAPIDGPDDLAQALAATGTPAILKTRRFGYDGKGQARVTDPADADSALATLNGAPAIAEGFVTFSAEISVIAARGLDGAVAAYDPGENVHENGILATTTVPAQIPASLRTDAVLIASRILNALDYIGVLGVELFVTPGGLVVNEIAPRVHNSGHWTQAGCGRRPVRTAHPRHHRLAARRRNPPCNVIMENLIGADIARAPALAAERGVQVHLYGKAETRPGRKMGHVNRVTGPA
jgi:5-(carboxyamino)imidazole ribonucleotide synthase